MAVNARLAQIGVGKQTAKGALTANPSFTFGVSSGQVAKLDVHEADLNLTWSDRMLQGHERQEIAPFADFETIATPKLLGLLLLGAIGQDTVTGAGPYTHTIKPGTAVDLPYLTWFGLQGTDYPQVGDSKIDQLDLIWDRTGALKAKVVAPGCGFAMLGSASFADGVSNSTTTYTSATATFSAATDNGKAIVGTNIAPGTTITVTNGTTIVLSQAATGTGSALPFTIVSRTPWTVTGSEQINAGVFNAAGGNGGTALMTVNGAAATIKQGTIKIVNGVQPVMGSDSVVPKDVMPGLHTVSLSLTLIPNDLSHFRLAVTGSASGTAAASVPTYIATVLKFALDANTDLTFTFNRMKVLVPWPAVNVAGGPLDVMLEGSVAEATAGDPYTAVLRNGQASY